MRWLNENSKKFLENWYLLPWQTVEGRVADIADTFEKYIPNKGMRDKFYDYMSKGWFSLSSPVWSNYWTDRGLPISCFTSYIEDDMASILYTGGEVWMMSKYWGGTAAYFWDLRPRGAEIRNNWQSSWAVHAMKIFDSIVDNTSQGSVRRGSFAAYYPIEGEDIEEFLEIAWEGNPIQRIQTWVTVTDKFIEEMKAWDKEKRKIWAKVIQSRSERGFPYIFFTDTVNNNTVDCYKDNWHKIHSSNLCSEIALPTSKDWSFVCCLSSMNLSYYDEWKDTDAVEVMVYFLDSVMQEFIDKLEKLKDTNANAFYLMERAYNFAKENRALGLGTLGYHTYLQKNNIPFESPEAREINKEMHKTLRDKSYKASEELFSLFGWPELLVPYKRRNATLNAIAPTTSSAFILGQASQSIEPIWSNCYVKDMAKLKVTFKNPVLVELLKELGQDTKEVWKSIRDRDGSVQHLDFLSAKQKSVFKTFVEINQYEIIDQAADRQKFIDQSQSLNLMVSPETPVKDINKLYLDAWEQGVKTLYYQHSKSAAQELSRKISCSGCEA